MNNTMRLIDVDVLLDLLRPLEGVSVIIKKVLAIIRNCPTVDAVEVVHGRWLYYSTTMQECSNCQRHTARHKFKYCPHCGAIMEDKYNDG